MNMILDKMEQAGIVPVIVLDDASHAGRLGKALLEGGITCAEITFRTDAAEEAIRIMRKENPDMCVGAGTILTVEQADRAVEAGAEFIISPGLNPTVVRHCIRSGIPIIPGCVTPGDVEKALELGLRAVKFFPAEAAGGVKYIKAISAPYRSMRFMPTGGINQENMKQYFSCKSVFACGGSWMVSETLIENEQFERIRELAADAVLRAKEYRRQEE